MVPFHKLCNGHDVLRKVFSCTDPAPQAPGTNAVLFAMEWTNDHAGKKKPWSELPLATPFFTPWPCGLVDCRHV